jgi:hypothetical protein
MILSGARAKRELINRGMHTMAYRAKKTEHAGAKHGNGAYWGPRKEAKQAGNTLRRRQGKHALLRDYLSSTCGYAP